MRAKRQRSARESGRQIECPYNFAGKASALSAGSHIPRSAYFHFWPYTMAETYEILGLDASETTTLDQYMQEYFTKILKKLKEVGGESRQRDFYL